MNFNNYVLEHDLGIVEINRSFRELTTIGCGGRIDYLYWPKDIDALAKAYAYIHEKGIKYFIIGNGSNVLASDEDFHGIVICLKKLEYGYEIKDDIMTCSAFYPTMKLAYDLAKEEWGDLSYLGGIPGLVGGAVYNNSGAYQKEIKDDLIDITYINTAGSFVSITAEQCHFAYRKSIFHYITGIIVSARFRVKKMKTLPLLLERQRTRKLSQPLECKSLGSIFKNNSLISAWKVIDALGMRGYHIGDAAISVKHANFIINTGHAQTRNIIELIHLIQRRAELEFGIQLVCEISAV